MLNIQWKVSLDIKSENWLQSVCVYKKRGNSIYVRSIGWKLAKLWMYWKLRNASNFSTINFKKRNIPIHKNCDNGMLYLSICKDLQEKTS